MIIKLGRGRSVVWNNGSHYMGEFDANGREYNVFSFAWEKNRPSQLDALEAFLRYESEEA